MILSTLVTSQLHFEMCAGLYGHPVVFAMTSVCLHLIVSLYGLKSKPILVNLYIWELYIGTQTNSLMILKNI